MPEREEDRLSDPTGGPSAQSAEGSEDQSDDALDPSAGAQGQDAGAVEEAREQEGEDKVNPG